ncbi:serine hydrolase domain-containing protein [Photobacterium sanguinicancri]|uniref:serine hydrolase domain-containing protein n=1 Tax=Photobacterium sanguinicancri TaxID=875932 RepID=UPI003D10CFC2
MKTSILHTSLVAILTLTAATHALASTPAKLERSNQYIDSYRSGYISGWKGMLTNSQPDKLLTSGIWFKPSSSPRPFEQQEATPLSESMKLRLAENSTDGLLVIKNNKIINQYFRYGFAINDIHLIHSTGKAFTSFAIQPVYDLIGQEGRNKQLSNYLPKLKSLPAGKVTFQQALDMQAGLEWSENYEDPTTHTMRSGAVGGWDPIENPQSWYSMADLKQTAEHGKTWIYNNFSVIASAFAAEAISGKPYPELVQTSYNKLGFEDRSWYVANKMDELSSEGGQALTIRDFAKLGRYMLEEKKSQYVNDVWNADGSVAQYMPKDKYSFAIGYKNYWYKISDNEILALGSSGQILYINKEKKLVIAKLSSFVQGQGLAEFEKAFSIISDLAQSN